MKAGSRPQHYRQVSISMYDICMKNLSPFFSSQERMTQGVVRNGTFLRVADMPVGFHPAHRARVRAENRTPYFWAVDEAVSPGKDGILRSYDGSAFVARIGPDLCQVWGNGSIPCLHLSPVMEGREPGGRVIFFIGPLEELEKQMLADDARPSHLP